MIGPALERQPEDDFPDIPSEPARLILDGPEGRRDVMTDRESLKDLSILVQAFVLETIHLQAIYDAVRLSKFSPANICTYSASHFRRSALKVVIQHIISTVPVYMPIVENFMTERAAVAFNAVTKGGSKVLARFLAGEDERYKISCASSDLITATLFAMCDVCNADFDEALKPNIDEDHHITVARIESQRQFKVVAASDVDGWLHQVMLPICSASHSFLSVETVLTVSSRVFMTFQEKPAFLLAATGDDKMPLAKWFGGKLVEESGVKLYHCIQKLKGKAIDIGSTMHRIWCNT
ncbi:hypothetical protein WAI453_013166 [Rhynchosporium graminicola]